MCEVLEIIDILKVLYLPSELRSENMKILKKVWSGKPQAQWHNNACLHTGYTIMIQFIYKASFKHKVTI